jgi:catechol 2,3-dioxygenase-like lactoylglutathione lyase family enzyme
MNELGVIRLHHVSLTTADLPRALSFYCGMLGGEVAHEFRNDAGDLYGAFIYHGNGTFVELFCGDAGDGPAGRLRHLCFEVADIEAAATRLRGKGYAIVVKRGRTDRVLQFFIEDADGNVVEFQQHDVESALRGFASRRASIEVALEQRDQV